MKRANFCRLRRLNELIRYEDTTDNYNGIQSIDNYNLTTATDSKVDGLHQLQLLVPLSQTELREIKSCIETNLSTEKD